MFALNVLVDSDVQIFEDGMCYFLEHHFHSVASLRADFIGLYGSRMWKRAPISHRALWITSFDAILDDSWDLFATLYYSSKSLKCAYLVILKPSSSQQEHDDTMKPSDDPIR